MIFGSPEVQIAILTERINLLGSHLKHTPGITIPEGIIEMVAQQKIIELSKEKDLKVSQYYF